jgi:biopolymer transport protein ExbB/TolQ
MSAAGTVPLGADRVSQALSGISEALKQPVHVVALLLLAMLAFELGRIAMEGWRRVRPGAPPLEQIARRAMADTASADSLARWAPGPLAERAVLGLAAAAQNGHDAIEDALASYELQIQRRLDRTRVLVRAGPAIGLMGTLIPLAPGLAALGNGSYTLLAGEMRVAFAATVVGILVGTGAFTLTLVRTRVYTEDLAALERAVAAREPRAPAHHRVPEAVGEHAT